MFREKYQKYNENIAPSEKLFQETLEKAKENKKGFIFSVKRSSIAACTLLVLGLMTFTVDAASGGAIRKALGLEKISIYSDDENATAEIYQDESGDNVIEVKDQHGGWTKITEDDAEQLVIDFHVGSSGYNFSTEFTDYMSAEDISWRIYDEMSSFFRDVLKGESKERKEAVFKKLEDIADKFESEAYKEGAHMAIDDLKNSRNFLIYEDDILEDENFQSTGEDMKVADIAWYKIDIDTIKFDKDGWAKVVADSVAGAKGHLEISMRKEGNEITEINAKRTDGDE